MFIIASKDCYDLGENTMLYDSATRLHTKNEYESKTKMSPDWLKHIPLSHILI